MNVNGNGMLTDAGIATVTLDAPPLNILSREVLARVRAQLAEAAEDAALRVLVLRSEGKHFSAGASVEEHLPPTCDAMIEEFSRTVLALYEFPLPVIAAVRGRCLGGGFELVQAADVVLAAEDALFGQPEIRLGVFPPAACALLPGRIGFARAAQLIFTGEQLTAEEARALGLVANVVPSITLDGVADSLARRIARQSGAALRSAKRALHAAAGVPPASALERATRVYLDELMRTSDAAEGLHAFLEKRTPEWSHR